MGAAVYTDLRSATRRDVEVVFEPLGVKLVDKLGVIIAYWPYEGLNLIEEIPGQTPFRLNHKEQAQRYLVCEDATLLEHIKTLPPFSNPPLIDRGQFTRFLMLGVTAFLCYVLASQGAESLSTPLSQKLPLLWEERVADGLLAQLQAQETTCANPESLTELEQIVQPLSAVAGLPFASTVHIVLTPEFNAYSLGAGHIVLTSGLLEETRKPEDLAAIIAHELAHTADRHPLAALVREMGLGFVARVYIDDFLGIRGLSQSALQRLAEARSTTEEETKASRIGLLFLAQIGIRGNLLNDFLLHVENKNGALVVEKFIKAHPVPLKKSIIKQPSESSLMNATEWGVLKNICSMVIKPRPQR
jgi:Zn-dependent protease with chaperone function